MSSSSDEKTLLSESSCSVLKPSNYVQKIEEDKNNAGSLISTTSESVESTQKTTRCPLSTIEEMIETVISKKSQSRGTVSASSTSLLTQCSARYVGSPFSRINSRFQ